jgi:hypothetical protein
VAKWTAVAVAYLVLGCSTTHKQPVVSAAGTEADSAQEDAENAAVAASQIENRLLGPATAADPPTCDAACGMSRNIVNLTKRICDLAAGRVGDARLAVLCHDSVRRRDRAVAYVAPRCSCDGATLSGALGPYDRQIVWLAIGRI